MKTLKNFGGGVNLVFEPNIAFADERQAEVRQLNEVAAGAYAAMFVYARTDVFIDQGDKEFNNFGMHT